MAYSAIVPAGPGSTFTNGKQFTATHAEQTRLNFIDHESRIVAATLSTTVDLTDAQVKLLPTTPVSLVAAPGSGFALVVKQVVLVGKFGAGAYTNVNATDSALVVTIGGTDFTDYVLNSSADSNTSMDVFMGAGDHMAVLLPWRLASAFYGGGVAPVFPSADYSNTALAIKGYNNGAGAWTGGNAANKLRVTVQYSIQALP